MKCKNPECGRKESLESGCCTFCEWKGVPTLLAKIERLEEACLNVKDCLVRALQDLPKYNPSIVPGSCADLVIANGLINAALKEPTP